jgi:hypothetical protein
LDSDDTVGLWIIAGVAATAPIAEYRPEDYGASGDGVGDDTDAFAAIATAINLAGQPALVQLVPGAVYRVGRQTFPGIANGTGSYLPVAIFKIVNSPALTIMGDGATLKVNDGLKVGTFDPVTGAVYGTVDVAIPSSGNGKYVAALGNVIEGYGIDRVAIRDLNIDGNDSALVKGGGIGVAGTTDYSVAGTGIFLQKVKNALIDNVHGHHLVLDGLSFSDKSTTINADGDSIVVRSSTFEYVGRNAFWPGSCSNLHVTGSKFNHAGRGAFRTAPSVGIDFEAYAPNVSRRALIESSELVDNASRGYSTAAGWGQIVFKVCTFRASGTRGEFATPTGPWVSHEDCTIYGVINTLGSDANDPDSTLKPLNGTAFRRCLIEDADFVQPVVFPDAFGVPTMQAESKQTYGAVTGTVAITTAASLTSNRWKCQVLYNGAVVETYDSLNTVAGALAVLNASNYAVFTDLGSSSPSPASQPAPATAITLPVRILDRSNGGLVAKAFDNAVFEDCTFIPHAVTAFNMSTNSSLVSPMVIRRCTVVPYNPAVADKANQSLIKQSILDGLRFVEPPGLTPPANGWYIGKDATVMYTPNGVTVGPSIHWGAWNGPTGTIARKDPLAWLL